MVAWQIMMNPIKQEDAVTQLYMVQSAPNSTLWLESLNTFAHQYDIYKIIVTVMVPSGANTRRRPQQPQNVLR